MCSIAEGLILALSAAAKGDRRPPGEIIGFPLAIQELDIPLDFQRSVPINSNCCCHIMTLSCFGLLLKAELSYIMGLSLGCHNKFREKLGQAFSQKDDLSKLSLREFKIRRDNHPRWLAISICQHTPVPLSPYCGWISRLTS